MKLLSERNVRQLGSNLLVGKGNPEPGIDGDAGRPGPTTYLGGLRPLDWQPNPPLISIWPRPPSRYAFAPEHQRSREWLSSDFAIAIIV
ncbi:MAG: hypothetical protein ACJ76B_01745 [Solirubrobacterales bacterium]